MSPAQSAARPDIGLTHIALIATDLDASVAFYERYAKLVVVHRRSDDHSEVVWLSDLTRAFAVVLLRGDRVLGRLEGIAHLGIGCESREEVDRLATSAREEGCLSYGPEDSGPPVGYWAFIRDPDGHNLEISFGQEVGVAVDEARETVLPQ